MSKGTIGQRVWFPIVLGLSFLAAVSVPLWLGLLFTWDTVPAGAAIVAAIVAIRQAIASDSAASKADEARKAAEKAANVAHYSLAMHIKPTVGMRWERRSWAGKDQWVLLPQSRTKVREIKGVWHFADGRHPVEATFGEIESDHPLGWPDPELVIALGIPGEVPITQVHNHVVSGRVEYTDGAGLALWYSEWKFKAPWDAGITELEGHPNADYLSGLVKLLDIPDDL